MATDTARAGLYAMATDLDLLKRYAADGDGLAFAQLATRHRDMVYRTCYRVLGNSADAEDAAQECFVALARSAGRVSASVGGWLHRVAARSARALEQREQAAREREHAAAEIALASEDAATWEEIRPHVDQAIDRLPDRFRVPLVLYYLDGRNQSAIAEELGVNQSTVSYRLSKAVERVRGHLRKGGILAGATALTALLKTEASHAAPASLASELGKLAVSGIGSGGAATTAASGTSLASVWAALGMWQVQVAATVVIVVAGGLTTYAYMGDGRQPTDAGVVRSALAPTIAPTTEGLGNSPTGPSAPSDRAVPRATQTPVTVGQDQQTRDTVSTSAAAARAGARRPGSGWAAGERGAGPAQESAPRAEPPRLAEAGDARGAPVEPRGRAGDELQPGGDMVANLQDDDAEARAAAAAAIAKAIEATEDARPYVDAIPRLIEMLADDAPAVRATATWAFTLAAAFQEVTDAWHPGVPVVVGMVDDEDAGVRFRTVWSLRVFASGYTMPGYSDWAVQFADVFAHALANPEWEIRQEAAWGLRNLAAGALRRHSAVAAAAPVLGQALVDPEPSVRGRSAEALSVILANGDPELDAQYRPDIEAMLNDPDPWARAQAAIALSVVGRVRGDGDAVTKAVGAMTTVLDEDDPVAVSLAGAQLIRLARLGGDLQIDVERVVSALAEAMRVGGMDADVPAAQALIGINSLLPDLEVAREAVPGLMGALSHPSSAPYASWALSHIGTDCPDPSILSAAAKTYIVQLRSAFRYRRKMAATRTRNLLYTTDMPDSAIWSTAVPGLIEVLGDDDPEVGVEAAKALQYISNCATDGDTLTPAFEALVDELGEQSSLPQPQVIYSIGALAGRIDDRTALVPALEKLTGALDDEELSQPARTAISRIAPQVGDCRELEAALLRIIEHTRRAAEEDKPSWSASRALGQMTGVLGDKPACSEALGILVDAAKSPDRSVLNPSLWGLWFHSRHGRCHADVASVLPRLDGALWFPDTQTLVSVVRLVAEVAPPDPSALHPVARRLADCLVNPDPERQRLAASGLAHIGPHIKDGDLLSTLAAGLVDALSSEDPSVRFEAAAALFGVLSHAEARRAHQACLRPAVQLMGDEAPHIRWAAARALAAIAAASDDPDIRRDALTSLADGMGDVRAIVRRACAAALSPTGDGANHRGEVLARCSFDDGTEGWTFYGNGWGERHHANAGNPGGCVAYAHQGGKGTHGFQAPPAFLGDMSAAYGGRLEYDLRSTAGQWVATGPADDLLLFGAGKRIVVDLPYEPAAVWTPYSVSLDESGGWRETAASGPPASADDIRQVLAALEAIRIRGRFNADAEMPRLDNVVLCAGAVGGGAE